MPRGRNHTRRRQDAFHAVGVVGLTRRRRGEHAPGVRSTPLPTQGQPRAELRGQCGQVEERARGMAQDEGFSGLELEIGVVPGLWFREPIREVIVWPDSRLSPTDGEERPDGQI